MKIYKTDKWFWRTSTLEREQWVYDGLPLEELNPSSNKQLDNEMMSLRNKKQCSFKLCKQLLE